MTTLRAHALAASTVLAAVFVASAARAQCVDEELKRQLIGDRAQRGVVPRLVQKALRHELSALGGWYAADIADGAPIYGGAYTFHFSEDLGLEASYLRTRQSYGLLESVVERQQGLVDIVAAPRETLQFFMGHLAWSLAYGKVRWFGGPIGRFDFALLLGAGAVDEPGGVGLTGSAGLGFKLYLSSWAALRVDVRDQIRNQRAPLGVERVVNDVVLLGGLSVFLPLQK